MSAELSAFGALQVSGVMTLVAAALQLFAASFDGEALQ